MEGSFRQNGFASEELFRDPLVNIQRPGVVEVSTIAKRHDESSVSDRLHRRAKPFRDERSRGPLIFPARLRKR